MNKRKSSWLSYVAPYLFILLIILGVSFLFGGNKSTRWNYTAGDIITGSSDETIKDNAEESVLWTDNIQTLVIEYNNGNFIDVSGTVKKLDTNGKEVNYAYSVRLPSDEHTENVLSYIVANRTVTLDDGKVAQYYTSSNFQIVDPNQGNFWSDVFPIILISVIGIGVLVFLVTRMSGAVSKSNSQAMDFNKSRARREDGSSVRFDDVAGCDEEKEEMKELVDYLKNPQKYALAGAKLPKGVLLVGPPGTGKTLLAKAVACEAKVPFYSISGSDFVEMFVGVGAGRVRDMFKKAKQTAPCIVFIDEIDAVGRQRGAGLGGGNDEREQTLNQLLVEMDGFADKVGREEILKVHARNKKFDETVNWAQVAKRTVGFSGADLASIINDAAILTVRLKKEKISIQEIDEAIDRRIAGPAKKSKHLTELERKTVAYHEAGHAIIGLLVPESDKVQKVTIVPRGMAGGYVLSTPEDDRFLMTKGELIARITGFLGGRSSEEIFFNDISTGASNDIEQATRIARAMVVEYGMSSLGPIQYESHSGSVFLGRDYTSSQKNFSGAVANEIDKEVRNIVETAHENAKKIILEHREDVELIAEALLEHETLNGEEIDYLLANRKMPDYRKETPNYGKPVVEEEKKETKTDDSFDPVVVFPDEIGENKEEE